MAHTSEAASKRTSLEKVFSLETAQSASVLFVSVHLLLLHPQAPTWYQPPPLLSGVIIVAAEFRNTRGITRIINNLGKYLYINVTQYLSFFIMRKSSYLYPRDYRINYVTVLFLVCWFLIIYLYMILNALQKYKALLFFSYL